MEQYNSWTTCNKAEQATTNVLVDNRSYGLSYTAFEA